MAHVPETKKTELEKIEEQIEVITEEWRRLGIHGDMTQHSNESIWMLKVQVQSLMNIVLKNEICTTEEMNLEFKRLVLNDMQILFREAKEQKEKALGLEVPKIGLLGPDGQPIKVI